MSEEVEAVEAQAQTPQEVAQEAPQEVEAVENTEQVAESTEQAESTESPEAAKPRAPKVGFTDEQQEAINQMMLKKVAIETRKREREVEAERKRLESEMEELRAKIPQETRPDVPPPPDTWDENYEQRIKERDALIVKQIRFDEQARLRAEAAATAAA